MIKKKERKKEKTRGLLEHQEERTTERTKIWINRIDFSFPYEFSKLCLMVEVKSITL